MYIRAAEKETLKQYKNSSSEDGKVVFVPLRVEYLRIL